MNDVIKIGLTGGIGSGKTTISKIFELLGIPVYNSDSNAKRLINSNKDLINLYKKLFGADVYDGGELNTKKVAEIIFTNQNILTQVEKMVHKAVRDDFEKWAKNQKSKFVMNEAAIMFESGGDKNMDYIITVYAPKELRIARVINRDDVTKEQVLNRMSKQWEDQLKIEKSHFVIYADENKMVIPQALNIISEIHEKHR